MRMGMRSMNNGIFQDETTLELPPGYRTVKLAIPDLQGWNSGNDGIDDLAQKIKEIIRFINMQDISVTGNEEFLEQFKDWIQ
jgi:hypothetical protein